MGRMVNINHVRPFLNIKYMIVIENTEFKTSNVYDIIRHNPGGAKYKIILDFIIQFGKIITKHLSKT